MDTTQAAPATSPPRRRGRRLGSLLNVRAALASVVRELEAEELDPARGNALVNALRTLASVIQGAELERRVVELEQRFAPPAGTSRAA